MIKGVQVKRLKFIPDERGRLMEILRCDDEQFDSFGQVYITTCYPGVVKGWHYHMQQTDNMCVIKGMAKIVLFDRRQDSETSGEVNEFFVGDSNPVLLHIPPEIAHGIKAIGTQEAIIINIPDRSYSHRQPDEFRIPPHSDTIPYDWDRRDG